MNLIDAVFIHLINNKANVIFGNLFAFARNMSKDIDPMSGNGIIVIRFDIAAENFVDIIQTR